MKTKLTSLTRRTMILGLAVLSFLPVTQADDTAAAKTQALRLAVDFMSLPASETLRPYLLASDVELLSLSAVVAPQPQPVDLTSLPGLSPSLEPVVTVPSSGLTLADIAGVDLALLAPVALRKALFTSVFDDIAADASIVVASR